MNIAIISCANTRCGIGRYSAELSSKYDGLNHDVTLYRKESGEEDYKISAPLYCYLLSPNSIFSRPF